MKDRIANLVSKLGYENAALIISSEAVDNLDYVYLAGELYLRHIEDESIDEKDLLERYKYRFTDDVWSFITSNYNTISSWIVKDRSKGYKYSSIKDLASNYLIRDGQHILEDVQWMWMRVAVQVAMPDMQDVKDTYDALSLRKMVHATPTCVNAGLRCNNENTSQLESCFLIAVGDSMESIADSQKLFLMGSKNNAGFGVDMGRIRHSQVARRGVTKGIPGLLSAWNSIVPYADQLGSRPGAATIQVGIHHIDIQVYIKMKDKNSSVQATNLNYAVAIPDLFMKRVEAGLSWSLFCPREEKRLWLRNHGGDTDISTDIDRCPCLHDMWGDEFDSFYEECENAGIASEVVDARELWMRICVLRSTIGSPFLFFKDNVNRKSNHKHLGTITQSNLCVRGDTLILTDRGHLPIKELADAGEYVNVWNGERWSSVLPVQTGSNQLLITLTFSNGSKLRCTHYHKFPVVRDSRYEMVDAIHLDRDDILIPFSIPDGYDNSGNYSGIKMVDVLHESEYADTYCVHEPQRHTVIFNSIITSNCMEVTQYTKPDEIAASCDLATINIAEFLSGKTVDYEDLAKHTRLLTRNLNRVLDRTSGILPSGSKDRDPAHTGRNRHRAIGIGVMGYASLISMMELEYESHEAIEIGVRIRACIYYHSIDESCCIAEKEGPCPSWYGSPLSKGILHQDMCIEESMSLGRNAYRLIQPSEFGTSGSWDDLRSRVSKGTRNTLTTCQMPNSTTSSIIGVSPGYEPFFSILYATSNVNRTSMDIYDSFKIVMERNGLYDPVLLAQHLKLNKGSIDNIGDIYPRVDRKIISHIRSIFKNGFSTNKVKMLQLYAWTGMYVDQAQSTNIFYSRPNAEYVSLLQIKAWKSGCKTLYYLHRMTTDKISLQSKKDVKKDEDQVCKMEEGCRWCQ